MEQTTYTHAHTGLAISGLRGEAVISPSVQPHESVAAAVAANENHVRLWEKSFEETHPNTRLAAQNVRLEQAESFFSCSDNK